MTEKGAEEQVLAMERLRYVKEDGSWDEEAGR